MINPPTTTTRVKISQNVDILAKVYLVHLKVKHCQTLRVVSTFTGTNELTVFDWQKHCLVLFRMVKMTSQNCPCVHIWVNSQNSNFQLIIKCLNSRRVKINLFYSNFSSRMARSHPDAQGCPSRRPQNHPTTIRSLCLRQRAERVRRNTTSLCMQTRRHHKYSFNAGAGGG